jgi:hypothetical protein
MRPLKVVTETTGRIAGSSSPEFADRRKWFWGVFGAGQMVSNQRAMLTNYRYLQLFTRYILNLYS